MADLGAIVIGNHNESDHDRLVRIETALHHLTEHLAIHTEELREHIRDESLDFSDLKSKLALHLQESESMQNTLQQVVKDINTLKSDKSRIVGWIAGAVFIVVVAWNLLKEWLTHSHPHP